MSGKAKGDISLENVHKDSFDDISNERSRYVANFFFFIFTLSSTYFLQRRAIRHEGPGLPVLTCKEPNFAGEEGKVQLVRPFRKWAIKMQGPNCACMDVKPSTLPPPPPAAVEV